jgi:replicative DNA helicase
MSRLDNSDAEQVVLGACLNIDNPHAYREAAAIVSGRDFYRPAHETIWDVIAALHAEGTPSDPVIVANRLGAELQRVGGAPYLHTLYQRAPLSASVAFHARLVAEAASLRRLHMVGKRIVQRAEESDDVESADLIRWAGEQLSDARDERVGVDLLTKSYDEFMAATPEQRRMVIPGMLGEGDRLVMTGQGGAGKSTLLLQMAVCAAAGLPPFDWHSDDPYEPVRVTVLDFENPDHRVKTRAWPMVKDCLDMGVDPRPNLTLGGSGNPLNLLNPSNALSLLRTIEHDKPRLLYIGPVYKMHNDDPDKETVVKKITDTLDAIRAMGVAIITEAHHTKAGQAGGSLEPSGSNLWTWWPEYGLGMRLQNPGRGSEAQVMRRCSLERWRVDRDAASWPDEIEATGKFGLAWARADYRGLRSA